MSYETRAYERTNDDGFPPDPVVVLVAEGSHDVSRLVNLLNGGSPVSEQLKLADHVTRQVRRHSAGRAALALLARHGGPDLLEAPDVTGALLLALVGYLDDRHRHEDGCWDGCREAELLAHVPTALLAEARRTTRPEAIAALEGQPASTETEV